jgi:phage repressor protein C with HTH and peptisase S24 domain
MIGDRLKERIETEGSSQADLARAIGVSPQAISKMVRGGTTDSPKLYQIARFLKTSPEYLTGESDDPSEASVLAPVADEDPDLVEIDMIDLSYGMGGGTFLDSDRVDYEKVKFSGAWLRQFSNSPPQFLASTRGMGDSMMPTIHDRDVVIIDKSQNRFDVTLGDKIWAIIYGGVGMIKRLRPLPDGSVKISSDNQLIRDELATDGDLFIVGRVIAKVSTL